MKRVLSDEERAFYFDFLKIQVQIITSRNQFLLVFQSMLLAALGVLFGRTAFFPIWLIIVIGLIVSLAWLYVNAVSHTNEKISGRHAHGMRRTLCRRGPRTQKPFVPRPWR